MTESPKIETEDDINARANEKSRIRKQARDKMLATKTVTKGLVMVHTGKGKGKSTAAFGLALRAIGQGFKVGVVQFVKGRWESGEREALAKFGDAITIAVMGEGFTWETQDRARDIKAAEAAWAAAKQMILAPTPDLVVLDEINIALRYEYLPVADVIATLAKRPPMKHVMLTGRNAPAELIEAADLVTEMTEIKHPFRAGVKAQRGIEF
jgi:cob(I)alamin adenosyltransferase